MTTYRTTRQPAVLWRSGILSLLLTALLLAQPAPESSPGLLPLEWTPFGNTRVLAGVAGYASGPVQRVWRTDSGEVMVALEDDSVWATSDFLTWTSSDAAIPPAPVQKDFSGAPHDAWQVLAHPLQPSLVFGLGRQVYRSVDGGRSFAGLSRYRGVSLLGETLRDLALNPQDPNDLLVASDLGLWRSRDGGLSWLPAGDGLDNLPMARILAFPEARRGLVVEQPGNAVLEWVPGAVNGWRFRSVSQDDIWGRPSALSVFGGQLVSWDSTGSSIYASLRDGRLLASSDGGRSWRDFDAPGWGGARQILINSADPLMAVALLDSENGVPVLARTLNGGLFWEDLTPTQAEDLEAIAADWEQNALVMLSRQQLQLAAFDFRGASRPAPLRRIARTGLPSDVRDLCLDPSGTLLFAVTARQGVYYAAMPSLNALHKVRHAADLSRRPAAPGDLLSIHGSPLRRMRANGRQASILATASQATQIQLPYDLSGVQMALEWETVGEAINSARLPLQRVSPAVFLHPDGSPFVLHSSNGTLVDENLSAQPGQRIQVMVSGLGAVRPDWPAGLPVPAEAPPEVVASIEARIDQIPLRVERATLAPGYTGIYLVEVVLPALMDEGLRELQIFADGLPSNSVALHVAYP